VKNIDKKGNFSMDVIEKFRLLAGKKIKTIVLPEGEEERIIRAAEILDSKRLVKPILLGDPDIIMAKADAIQVNLAGIDLIRPDQTAHFEDWAQKFYQMRKHKGLSRDEARESLKNSLYYGAFMLKENQADGAVAGSINTTGDVLRAAIQVVGLAENVSVVSSSFLMVLQDDKILTFADCAVIPNPDPSQLASIAISSARTHELLVKETPKVALLSFSTKGSANHEDADKVIEATNLLKELAPDLIADGELQFDAAYVKKVADKKAPDSVVGGEANVFIFPDLDAGNIGYKLTQRLAGAEAIGPIIQGLRKPYNDLSRGCSVEDVVNVACICSILS
jgi:phosphate acetyltransferase